LKQSLCGFQGATKKITLELQVEAANGLKARQWLSTFLNSQNSNNIQVIFKVKPETANVQFFSPALLLGINTACRRNENMIPDQRMRIETCK